MQNIGLEWLWRIKEDPLLWRRYLWDGLALLKLLAGRVLPYAWYLLHYKPDASQLAAAAIETTKDEDNYIIHLRGAWTLRNIAPLRESFANAAAAEKNIRLDMSGVNYVDSAFLGLVMLLHGYQTQHRRQFNIVLLQDNVLQIFRYCCADFLYKRAGMQK
jgi:N-acetylglucosaminyldiphosphoundecaprenol N-acetyl-beta-D-mannosaminyltransferase